MRPEKPPIENMNRNEIANNIGGSNVSEPLYIVAVQLKTFTPVGTAINIVASMKNIWPASGMPTVNMWCAHTMNDRNAIEAIARSEEHTSELQSRENLVCRLLLEKKNND